ncbi:ubiquinone biosynthesis protein COQ9 [Xylariaceae sp. FL1019]|nr:ubiquinone biosynthesis protein COQ9 [Xylariaceae sp. FL1019]
MAPSRAVLARAALPRRLPRAACRIRPYHSYDHPSPPGVGDGGFTDAEQAILSAAYRHVTEHGFTHHALSLGARDAGYLDISTNLIPNGPFSLIRWHLVTQREALASRTQTLFPATGPVTPDMVPARVERLTWERLLANSVVNHRWQEALAIMAQPTHVPSSLHELALLADEIHHLAGDVSVDPTWYTKRAGLSMIYTSSELFMTNDRSPAFQDTRDFLQRRFAQAGTLSGAVGSVAQWVGFTASAGVNVLRSKGVRI